MKLQPSDSGPTVRQLAVVEDAPDRLSPPSVVVADATALTVLDDRQLEDRLEHEAPGRGRQLVAAADQLAEYAPAGGRRFALQTVLHAVTLGR